jgi:glycosyltransferase involved in cell wall biosynthesis
MLIGGWRLLLLALKVKADIYHFHDPELIPACLLLKLLGKKIIYDVHELVFFSIKDKAWIKRRILKSLYGKAYLLMERLSVAMFDSLILAEDDYENYYKERYKATFNFAVIRNYPVLRLIDSSPPARLRPKSGHIILYVGGLARVRGIIEVINAIEALPKGAELWLLGPWESAEFRKECERQSGWTFARYQGNVRMDEVYGYMKCADIGICSLYPVRNYVRSLPVKAFEYMACRLPMVMSDFPYWRQVFDKCAVFANPRNPVEIADKISFLLENPEKAAFLGAQGRHLVETDFNWETECKKLISLYGAISNEQSA